VTTTLTNSPPTTQSGKSSSADESVLATFGNVKDDVSQLTQDVAECASSVAHTSAEAVKSSAVHVAEFGKKAAGAAKDSHGRLCEYVSAHPTTAILIAAGVGALVARILPRR
jgi:ElaB/YqjD/DUF883 family membrane-anchored ribosome-binding protein